MTEYKQFSFGVDIPNSWKQKTRNHERRFVDLEGFLDEDYDGEHHVLWDNQKEKWCHLDDALCLMEEVYCSIRKENEVLKDLNNQELQAYRERVLSVIDDAISKHHLDDDDIEDNLPYYMNVKGRIEALQDLRKELSE